jgi:hypothetical protein
MPQTERTPETDPALAGQNVLAEITKHIYLVCLTIGWPKLSYKIGDAIVEITKEDGGEKKKVEIDEEFRNDPAWQLMPDDWKIIFTKLEGKGRKTLSSSSTSFATKGISLLPISRAEGVFQVLDDFRREWEMQRDLFAAKYAEILMDIERKLKAKDTALWNKVRTKLPDAVDIKSKFTFRWSIIPMGGDGRVGLQATREQLEQVKDTLQLGEPHIDMVAYEQAADTLNNLIDQTYETVHHLDTDTASALVREAKETIVELGHQLVENMCKEPREQIAKTVENMLESLRGGRRVREGTIRQIKESFELMRGFDFVADQTLLNQMRECERALDSTTVQQLNASQDTGRRISRYLQDVVDQATNPEAVEEVQQQFRGIRGALNLTPEEVPA